MQIIHNMHSEALPSKIPKRLLWLDTHIWHTTRFHMVKKWDFSLPSYHTSRGERFVSKALSTSALMQDVSYIRPIEVLNVSLHHIIDMFDCLVVCHMAMLLIICVSTLT
jgi:hypothetical protein